MFDRHLEFETSDPETQVSMIMSNYYSGKDNEYDYLPEYPIVDPLEIIINEKLIYYLNETIKFTKRQKERIKKSRRNKSLYRLLKNSNRMKRG